MMDFTLGTMYWLNPKRDAAGMAEDCRRIRDNGYRLVRIIAWWELVEKIEGRYDFSFLDRFFSVVGPYGLRVMFTIGFYPPYWLSCKLDSLGKNDPGRYPSLQREEVCEPLAKLIAALVNRYQKSPSLESWNVWNEPTLNATRHPAVIRKFAAWLKEKYHHYDELQQNWQGEFPVLSLLMPDSWEDLNEEWLTRAFRLGSRGRTSAIEYDFHDFCADLLAGEVRWLCAEIRKHDTRHPTHANLHSVNDNPVFVGRDFYRTAAIPDTISCSLHQSNDNPGNSSLPFRKAFFDCGMARTWSWRKDDNSMVGELQIGTSDVHLRRYTPTPETVFYELWGAYAAGLRGVIHWEWQPWRSGTLELGEFCLRNPSDGGETRRSRAVRRFAQIFERHREVLQSVRKEPSKIAILDPYGNSIYRYLQWRDHQNAPISMVSHNAIIGCYRALDEANLPVDFVSEAEVAAGKLENYRILYLPEMNLCSAVCADRIRDFVMRGGAVWADGRFAWLDEHMYLRDAVPGHGLDTLFGCHECDYTAAEGSISARTADGVRLTGCNVRQDFDVYDNGSVYARYDDGSVAAVEAFPGQGRTRLWGLELSRAIRNDVIPEVEEEIVRFAFDCGVKPFLELPKGLSGKFLHDDCHVVAVLRNVTESPLAWVLPVPGRTLCTDGLEGQTLTIRPGAVEVVTFDRQK